MAGIHGKNVILRVSTSETVLSGVAMTGSSGSYFQIASGSRDWKYDRDRTLIQFANTAIQGEEADVDTSIDTQTRLINYAGGAIHLGQYPAVHSGVYAMAVSMTLANVGNLVGDAKRFEVNVNTDPVDTTTIGEVWKTSADGVMGFEGTLEGLYIDNFWYTRAVQTLSGLTPQMVLKFIPDEKAQDTYFQGTVKLDSWSMAGGVDSAIESNQPFMGQGPLDHVLDGVPFFKIHETTDNV